MMKSGEVAAEGNGRPQISVALCMHNGARFIEKQIGSILQQELLPVEIVISDDASSDAGLALVQQVFDAWKATHVDAPLTLRVQRQAPALGVTRNFQAAVSACSGDLIALCDQDDVWHPDRLRRMAHEFTTRLDLQFLHADARLIDAQDRPLTSSLFGALQVRAFELAWIHQGRAIDVFLRRNLAAGTTVMFRRGLLAQALPFPQEWVHDEWLATVAAALGGVDVLESALTDYRQHANNQIGAAKHSLLARAALTFNARGSQLALRARKAELLLQRLQSLGPAIAPEVLDKARGKLAHQRFRVALPAQRYRRLPAMVREWRAGHYQRFGRAFYSVVWDLLGPA